MTTPREPGPEISGPALLSSVLAFGRELKAEGLTADLAAVLDQKSQQPGHSRAADRLRADGYLSVDGRVIYAMKDFTVQQRGPQGS